MGNGPNASLCGDGVQLALEALERHLHELDRLSAHKAAAHLDAAIQQLKRDQAERARRPTPIPLRSKVPT